MKGHEPDLSGRTLLVVFGRNRESRGRADREGGDMSYTAAQLETERSAGQLLRMLPGAFGLPWRLFCRECPAECKARDLVQPPVRIVT